MVDLSEEQRILLSHVKNYPLERMFRDAELTQIFEGANRIQRMVIGRELCRG